VIVPTFNRAQYLGEAIDSLLNQTRPPAQIIVVDDGSTDTTPDVARSYGDRVRYIRKENGGKASAVNVGLRESKNEYVYVFDDDDIACPDAIEKLIEPLENDRGLGFSHGGLTHFVTGEGGTHVEILRPDFTVTKRGFHFTVLQQRCSIAHNASIVRRRCYEEVGYLDESYKRSEDFEFLLRLTSRFDGVSVPARVLKFRDHAGLRGDASSQHGIAVRDRIHYQWEQKMFRSLRGKVAIERYVGKQAGGALTADEQFDAWFLRSISMAAHGLWPEFDEDIAICAKLRATTDAPLSQPQAKLLSQGFSHWYGYVDEHGKCVIPRRSVMNAVHALDAMPFVPSREASTGRLATPERMASDGWRPNAWDLRSRPWYPGGLRGRVVRDEASVADATCIACNTTCAGQLAR
jgi:glycosyltransferase involved in cell wall biosynthesis